MSGGDAAAARMDRGRLTPQFHPPTRLPINPAEGREAEGCKAEGHPAAPLLLAPALGPRPRKVQGWGVGGGKLRSRVYRQCVMRSCSHHSKPGRETQQPEGRLGCVGPSSPRGGGKGSSPVAAGHFSLPGLSFPAWSSQSACGGRSLQPTGTAPAARLTEQPGWGALRVRQPSRLTAPSATQGAHQFFLHQLFIFSLNLTLIIT